MLEFVGLLLYMFEVKVKLNHGISNEDFSKEAIHDIIENNKKSCETGLYYSSSLFCFSNSTNF